MRRDYKSFMRFPNLISVSHFQLPPYSQIIKMFKDLYNESMDAAVGSNPVTLDFLEKRAVFMGKMNSILQAEMDKGIFDTIVTFETEKFRKLDESK